MTRIVYQKKDYSGGGPISTSQIVDGAITSDKIADAAVTADKVDLETFVKVLWENPTPLGSMFADTVLTLSSQDFDYCVVFFKVMSSWDTNQRLSSGIIEKGRDSQLFSMTPNDVGYMALRSRMLSWNASGNLVAAAGKIQTTNQTVTTASDYACVPTKVLGFKVTN